LWCRFWWRNQYCDFADYYCAYYKWCSRSLPETSEGWKMTTQIKLENVSKIFGPNPKSIIPLIKEGKSKEEILKETNHTVGVYDATVDIKKGEVFVVMGLSGSGKSTLIRCFNLLNVPTDGSVFIDGQDLMACSKNELKKVRQEKIAMVFQHFGLFDHRTVLANVEYGLEIRQMDKKERRETA